MFEDFQENALLPAHVIGVSRWRTDDGKEGVTISTIARPRNPRANQLGFTAQNITGEVQCFEQFREFELPARLLLEVELARGPENRGKVNVLSVRGTAPDPKRMPGDTPPKTKAV